MRPSSERPDREAARAAPQHCSASAAELAGWWAGASNAPDGRTDADAPPQCSLSLSPVWLYVGSFIFRVIERASDRG